MFSFQRMMWLCLLLACLGSGWFSWQYFLVPHAARFTPDWQGARWIQAGDGTTPVAYFRDTIALNSLPDTAYVTIEASQVFRLFVNGTSIGSNAAEFLNAGASRAYMYDITSALQPGTNAVAVRVANLDQQLPRLRAVVGIVQGKASYYQGTNSRWLATARSVAVFPRYLQNATAWAGSMFDASSWLSALPTLDPPADLELAVNPLLYTRPLATQWMSPGAGRQAYFLQRLSLPPATTSTWLRVGANGNATIFINGVLFAQWNGQPADPQSSLADYFNPGPAGTVARRTGLALGMYNVSSYMHPGVNTIAVSVVDPGNATAPAGLSNLNTAALVEVLTSDAWNQHTWITPETPANNWHAARQFVAGWTRGDAAALVWPSPVLVSRPGALRSLYLCDNSRSDTSQAIPLVLVGQVVLLSIGAVLGLWLVIALTIMRHFSASRRAALETTSLAYLPALSCEALLLVLSREPQLPQPFPYTWFWGSVLLLLVAIGYLLLCLNAWKRSGAARQTLLSTSEPDSKKDGDGVPAQRGLLSAYRAVQQPAQVGVIRRDWTHLFSRHWALFLLMVVAIPLIFYNLAYEPYWQDELTSFDAAKGILAHGYPALISGFIYPKGELYSYCLALFMRLFGDQGGTPRMLSATEYLASLPLLYFVGCSFFERHVALLATAMLALSPSALVWGRQVRMYEQAQVLTLVVFYLFYRAARQPDRPRMAYLAIGCLVLDYLSHEEVFIVLPALLIGVLLFSRDGKHRLPAVLYNKHWWFATALGAGVIIAQLAVVKFSHPPVLGTDGSEQPFIQVNAENIPFYISLLFFPTGKEPVIVMNSILALCGCLGAIRSADRRVKYCALFLVVSFLTLMLVFTMRADRYFYPLLPTYYLLGAYVLLRGLRAIWTFALARAAHQQAGLFAVPAPRGHLPLSMRLAATWTALLFCACVVLCPLLPLNGYNLFISRLTGFSYHRHYTDSDNAGQYVRSHLRKGDIVISITPDYMVYYYIGQADYFFSIDRALFLFERDGHIIDTSTGGIALLRQEDLQTVLASHARIWLISDSHYQVAVFKRFAFPVDLHIVYEGYDSLVYLRGSP